MKDQDDTGSNGAAAWFTVFRGICTHWLGRLSGLQVKIVWAYLKHANSVTIHAYPSNETIARLCGEKNKNRVRRSIRHLEKLGLLVLVTAGGGRNRTSVYRVACPQTGTESVPLLDNERGTETIAQTGTLLRAKGDKKRPKGGRKPSPDLLIRTPKNYSSSTTGGNDGDGGRSPSAEEDGGMGERQVEVRQSLRAAGVWPSAIDELVGIPGLTPAIVRLFAAGAVGANNPPAALAKRLRDEADHLAEIHDEAEQRDRQMREMAEDRRATAARIEAEEQARASRQQRLAEIVADAKERYAASPDEWCAFVEAIPKADRGRAEQIILPYLVARGALLPGEALDLKGLGREACAVLYSAGKSEPIESAA